MYGKLELGAKSKTDLFISPLKNLCMCPQIITTDFCKERIIKSAGDQSLVYMADQVQQNKRVSRTCALGQAWFSLFKELIFNILFKVSTITNSGGFLFLNNLAGNIFSILKLNLKREQCH